MAVLFLPESECAFLETQGFMRRVTHQFHWLNRGYETFVDFAADLRSSKRKQILKERRRVRESGLEIDLVEGDGVTAEHMDAMWSFYRETTGRKWGQAYLNREFFEEIAGSFRNRLVALAPRGFEIEVVQCGIVDAHRALASVRLRRRNIDMLQRRLP